jgi:hypothetical protein
VNNLPRFARSLLIGLIVAVGIYMLTDGRFLFVPLLFLPALPLFRKPTKPDPNARTGVPRGVQPTKSELPPPPPDPAGKRADPRWN